MSKQYILVVLLACLSINLLSEDGLSETEWEKAVSKHDYTETYKEFEVDTTDKKLDVPDLKNNTEFKNPELLKIIVLIVISLILLALIIMLILSLSKIKTTHKISSANLVEEVDDPDQFKLSDLEHYLEEALLAENYRLAIRIRFLMLIKALKEYDLISWKKEKTNIDYLKELEGKDYQKGFKYLIITFEKIWYANYSIEKFTYNELSVKFDTILKLVQIEK